MRAGSEPQLAAARRISGAERVRGGDDGHNQVSGLWTAAPFSVDGGLGRRGGGERLCPRGGSHADSCPTAGRPYSDTSPGAAGTNAHTGGAVPNPHIRAGGYPEASSAGGEGPDVVLDARRLQAFLPHDVGRDHAGIRQTQGHC